MDGLRILRNVVGTPNFTKPADVAVDSVESQNKTEVKKKVVDPDSTHSIFLVVVWL